MSSLSQQRITKVRSLLLRASRWIESLWRKTRIRNSSALFRFVSPHVYKPQSHISGIICGRSDNVNCPCGRRGAEIITKKRSDHKIFITKIYIRVISSNFTKILNHENLELYGIKSYYAVNSICRPVNHTHCFISFHMWSTCMRLFIEYKSLSCMHAVGLG